MRINIDINVGHFDDLADAYVNKVVRPAMATGLNNAAEHIKQDLSKATLTAFDRPKPFTQSAFTFFKAVPRKGKDINAVNDPILQRIQRGGGRNGALHITLTVHAVGGNAGQLAITVL